MLLEELVLVSISFIMIGIGLLLNGFTVLANLFCWMKDKTLQTINVLITGLGLVRILLLTVYAKSISFFVSGFPSYHVDAYPEYVDTIIVCLVFCSLWWGSVLCVFYCVKITNYSNRLFLRLKMNISKMVPRLLLISLVISFLSSLPCRWLVYSIPVGNGTNNGNGTMEVNLVNLFTIMFAGSIVPFGICCVALYVIIVSLLRHTRNMNSRDSGFSDAQRDIHLSVIRSMITFLLFYVMYFVAYIMIIITIEDSTYNLICFICICFWSNLHSLSLIFSNKKLKNSFCVVLTCIWVENIK